MDSMLLVVEPKFSLRRAAERTLPDGVDAIGASTLRDGLDVARQRHVGAAIIDVVLPDGSGLDIARSLRARSRPIPVLLVTRELCPKVVNGAQAIGAELLVRPFHRARLTDFTKRHLAALSRASVVRVGREEASIVAFAERVGLSRREREIMHLAFAGHGRAEIAKLLDVSDNTAKSLIRSLLRKTGGPDLATVVWRISHQDLALAI